MDRSLVGACGVFYVSAELSRRGWIAMPTIRNTSGIDIVATKDDRDVKIQVKTNSYGKVKYPMKKSNEKLIADDLYYVFVTLKGEYERPDFYVLRSEFVARYIKETHEIFVTLPPRRRLSRKETKEEKVERRRKSTMRQFPNYVGEFASSFKDFSISECKDKWEILQE